MDSSNTPIPVRRAVRMLGFALRDARKRRRIPMQLAAERAGISRSTLTRIEKGDEGVSLGAYAKVIFILGMIQKLVELADPKLDEIGLGLDSDRLPKRIRLPSKKDA